MRRIHIFGASGSGTSTLGRAISARYGYFFMDTDDYFWLPTDPPFAEKRPREERLSLIRRDFAAHEKAVLCGSLCGWGDALIPLFDLAVRLELPHDLRMRRLQEREKNRYGSRILPGGDLEETHRAFWDWASRYDTAGTEIRSLQLHKLWEKQLCCPVVCLDSAKPVEELLLELEPYLS